MYILSIHMWFQGLVRTFFYMLDKTLLNFITTLYDLLITIARTSVLSQADILDMADRVYKLLAVFMVFKVTFSLIMYVVNPDDFSDKSKGVSKLGMNIVFSLAMLILTPYIFNYAYQLQTIILEDNSLATLVFGDKIEDNSTEEIGEIISFNILAPFFTPNLALFPNCTSVMDGDSFNQECSGISDIDGVSENMCDNSKDTLCYYANRTSEDKFFKSYLVDYVIGVEIRNTGLMFRDNMASATTNDNSGNETFVMEYKFIFSTIVIVVVILLLISFCLDVALRSIKLAFLQLIAPIPILSYVDPKSGKDGMFKKWYQMCFKTYLSLFLRLLALYFAVYIISRVDRMVDIVDGSYQTNMLVKIFVIIGALMFAKNFTKLLEGLGLKLDGGFTLNPLKKFEEQALGGKNITGMARGAISGTAGALTGAGAMAGISGAFRGLTSGKGWKESGKATAEMNRKMRQAKLDGSTFAGRLGARVAGVTGLRSKSENIAKLKKQEQNEIDRIDNQIKEVEEQQKRIKGSEDYVARAKKIKDKKALADSIKALETRAKEEIQLGNSSVGKEYLRRKAEYDSLKQNGVKKIYITKDSNGNIVQETRMRAATATELADAEERMNSYLNDQGMKDYMTGVIDGTIDDKTFVNLHKNAQQAATNAGTTLESTGGKLHTQLGNTKGDIGQLERDGNADQRTLAELDEQIAKYNKEKSPHNDRIRELSEQEVKIKADENVIK